MQTWPLQLLRRRIEDDGPEENGSPNSNQKYKNKRKKNNKFFEETSLELGYSDIDNVWRTDD